jgi:hypothetical protein
VRRHRSGWLNSAGLPTGLTVDFATSLQPGSTWSAMFTYTDVPAMPTISNPKLYKQSDSAGCR